MSGTAPHGDLPTDAREKLKELYLQAMDMDSTARELFLDRAETDTATREEILRLLRYSGQAIITSDVGQHQMWIAQLCRFNEPRLWINSGGLGSMGFGL